MISDGLIQSRTDEPNRGLAEANGIRVIESTTPEWMSDKPAFEISALLHVLRRRWKLAAPLGLILAAVGAFVGYKLLQPKYSASAFLRIDSEDRPLVFQTADQAVSKLNFNLYKNTQKQLMTAPFVINAALRDKSVGGINEVRTGIDPVQWLTERLQVEFPGGGEIMQVSVQMASEADSVALVNAVVDAYMNEVVVDERNKRLKRLDNLERVYAEAEGKVRTKQSELKRLADLLGTGNSESLTVVQQNAIQQFGLMQQRLSEVQFKKMESEGDLSVARELENQVRTRLRDALAAESAKRTADKNATALVAKKFPSNERLRRLENEIILDQERVNSLLKQYASSHPIVVTATNQLQSKRMLYAKQQRVAKAEWIELQAKQANEVAGEPIEVVRLRESHQKTKSDVLGLQTKVAILENQEKILQDKVNALEEETRQLGRSSIDIELMRSEISGLEQVRGRVGEEIERTSIELKTASRITLLGPAESAAPPSERKRIAVSIAFAGMGFCTPLAFLGIWDLSRKKVSDLKSIHSVLPLQTLGTIPLVSQRTLNGTVKSTQPRRLREKASLIESIDSLAAMIRHRSESEQRNVFMLTSAVEGEGKTTVACQLARSLSRSGMSVLLMDFDFRRPSVHRHLRTDASPGVTEILNGEADWQDAIHKMDDLCVLPAGQFATRLNEREVNGAVADLFLCVRQQFDFVIVDCCPVLPVADARVIGKYCDGAILTLIRDVSRFPAAESACEILLSHNVEILGTVVIGAGQKTYGY